MWINFRTQRMVTTIRSIPTIDGLREKTGKDVRGHNTYRKSLTTDFRVQNRGSAKHLFQE